jgi:hypothetical protein
MLPDMKRKLAKIAAVASSLTLVGVYVGYRAFATSKTGSPAGEREVLMPSSKRADIAPPPLEEPAPERKREFIGGSKSAMIVEPEDTEIPAVNEPAKKDGKKPGGK